MAKPLRIAVSGASGRLGKAILESIAGDTSLACAAQVGRAGALGPDGEVMSLEEALAGADVVVDVSVAAAVPALAARCALLGRPLVVGVTGLDVRQQAALDAAAQAAPVLQSGNFSLGVNLLLSLVRQAARALDPAYDIEIVEAHHRRKIDAPSGTALMLGQAAAQGRGVELDDFAAGLHGDRSGKRQVGAIGFSVIRGGDVVGEHAVSFCGDAEIVTLSHSARDRSLFADGAVAAARWIIGRAPGLYGMADVVAAAGRP